MLNLLTAFKHFSCVTSNKRHGMLKNVEMRKSERDVFRIFQTIFSSELKMNYVHIFS